jgi:hypothetical protein
MSLVMTLLSTSLSLALILDEIPQPSSRLVQVPLAGQWRPLWYFHRLLVAYSSPDIKPSLYPSPFSTRIGRTSMSRMHAPYPPNSSTISYKNGLQKSMYIISISPSFKMFLPPKSTSRDSWKIDQAHYSGSSRPKKTRSMRKK